MDITSLMISITMRKLYDSMTVLKTVTEHISPCSRKMEVKPTKYETEQICKSIQKITDNISNVAKEIYNEILIENEMEYRQKYIIFKNEKLDDLGKNLHAYLLKGIQ